MHVYLFSLPVTMDSEQSDVSICVLDSTPSHFPEDSASSIPPSSLCQHHFPWIPRILRTLPIITVLSPILKQTPPPTLHSFSKPKPFLCWLRVKHSLFLLSFLLCQESFREACLVKVFSLGQRYSFYYSNLKELYWIFMWATSSWERCAQVSYSKGRFFYFFLVILSIIALYFEGIF
jgi:hypothetical protein